MKKINNYNQLSSIKGGDVNCEHLAGVVYTSGLIMMAVPGFQVVGLGLAVMGMGFGSLRDC